MSARERRHVRPVAPEPLPRLHTDEEAARFVEEADLTRYDLSGFRPVRFEFAAKDARITLRLPAGLLAELRREAEARGVRYQRLVREFLELGLAAARRARAAGGEEARSGVSPADGR